MLELLGAPTDGTKTDGLSNTAKLAIGAGVGLVALVAYGYHAERKRGAFSVEEGVRPIILPEDRLERRRRIAADLATAVAARRRSRA